VKRFPGILMLVILAVPLTGCPKRVLVQPVVDISRYNRIAVLPFETDSFLSTVGNELADDVVVELLKRAPGLEVVERARVDALIREQDLARSGYVNPESAIAVGRMLGVRAILTGSVSVSIGDIRPTPLNSQRVATGQATVRLIDTETGRVLWGTRESSDYSTFLSAGGGESLSVKTDHEMVQAVIQKLADAIARAFYPHYELQY